MNESSLDKKCLKRIPGRGKGCIHYLSPDTPKTCGFCGIKDEFLCKEALKKITPRMSYSAMKTLLQCPWKYYLKYIKGITLKPHAIPEAMKAGNVWDAWVGSGEKDNSDREKYQLEEITWTKLLAMWQAYNDFKLKPRNAISQKKIELYIGNHFVLGYADFDFGDGIGEVKLSGNPWWYLEKSSVYMQVGTYLLYNSDWQWAKMMVCRLPGLKQKDGETLDKFYDRVYLDISHRPHYYFIDHLSLQKTWGKKFFRTEIDLEYVQRSYINAFKLLRFYIDNHIWPKNDLSCLVPSVCEFYESKKSGVLSEELFTMKSKPKAVPSLI